MYEFEYNNVIDYWSDKFRLTVTESDRSAIVKLYESNEQKFEKMEMDFNIMCKQVLLHSYLQIKYPNMDLFESAYSMLSRN